MVEKHGTPIDTLAAHLTKELAYKSGEKDLVILNHDIGVQTQGGSRVYSCLHKFEKNFKKHYLFR